VDASLGFDSAFTLTPGTDASDTLCPRRDQDYWKIDLSRGQLVTADASYDKMTTMQLALDWYGPVGACMPSAATPCSATSSCTTGQMCDTARGGCRRTATDESCTTDSECHSGEHCVAERQKLATILDPNSNASQHRVVTAFASAMAGTYFVVVRDNLNAIEDGNVHYHLATTVAANPDTHEPNDSKNIASTLVSGQQTEGYLSHRGGIGADPATTEDIDWDVITPTVAPNQPIVTVELSWPDTSAANPTWTLYQGTTSFPSTKMRTTGSGTGATYTRRAALVMPDAAAPIYLAVSDSGTAYDTTVPYKLTVTLAPDNSEGATRNDTPDSPTVVNLPTTSSSFSLTGGGTLVTENDQDWYRIDAPGSSNSLVHMLLDATGTSSYILVLTTFVPNSQSCTNDASCPTGGRCLTASHTCIVPWVQRPSPDGPGDPQIGGLTPNRIETQLPLLTSNNGVLYVLVTNTASTFQDIPGYSPTDAYSFAVQRKAEPDPGDQGTPDNKFVARPLAPNIGEGDFKATARALAFAGSGPYTVSGGGWISYEGDQDFFTIPLTTPSATGWGISLRARMGSSSPLDIRINAAGGDGGAGYQSGGDHDDCSTQGCSGGTCDPTRKLCTEPAFDQWVGPRHGSTQSDCAYIKSGTSAIDVWVNDAFANDWDEGTAYSFDIELTVGCPTFCAGTGACTP
jgi:hypothetical protein